jgi:endonuclease/exonuclease/phosphatase family metal-dependent hydrolase
VIWTRKHYPFTPLLWWRAEGLALLTPESVGEMISVSISPGTSTWTYRHRVAMAATVTRGSEALRTINTHLASHDADERIAQARRVVAIIGARRPSVVAATSMRSMRWKSSASSARRS